MCIMQIFMILSLKHDLEFTAKETASKIMIEFQMLHFQDVILCIQWHPIIINIDRMRGYKIHPVMQESKQTGISSKGVDYLREQADFANNTTTTDILGQQYRQCQICCESAQMFQFCQCGHTFCMSCLCKYVEEKMNQNDKIVCCHASCEIQLEAKTDSQGRTMLFTHNLDNESRAQLYNYLSNYKQLRRGCSICSANPQSEECEDCRSKQQIVLPAGHKFCPSCRNIIEKTKGCEHVKCVCSHQFCFSCESKWSNSHICEHKIPQRTGYTLIFCCIAKIPLYTLLIVGLTPIYLSLGLLFCVLSAFIFGFFMEFKLLEIVSKNQDLNEGVKFILFLLIIAFTPGEVMLGAIPGFFIPIYNIFSQNKVLYSTNVLMELVDGLLGCVNLLTLV